MKAVPDQPATWSGLQPALRDSWGRSAAHLANPASAVAPIEFDDDALASYRREHPLVKVLPVFEQLLMAPAAEAGLIVAVGDAQGRLLWVDGAPPMLRRAEAGAFVPGANWSESAIGTSAPGIALATGGGAQVHREEHYAYSAQAFSCSAAPVHHPLTGVLLGVVDITGGDEAVATHSLPLVRAAIRAAEAELKILPEASRAVRLSTLGTANPVLTAGPQAIGLSLRHAEILVLLSWYQRWQNRPGLSAAELAELLYGAPGHEVTLRAEVVRLRRRLRLLSPSGPFDLLSRPYRLAGGIEVDAVETAKALTAGDRSAALELYGGHLLLASEAPGILKVRGELAALLRESLLADGSAPELWRYVQLPEAADDLEAVYAALGALPPQSPQRAALVARAAQEP